MSPKRSSIRRYIAMRREKRHNERQHAKCIAYVGELQEQIRKLKGQP